MDLGLNMCPALQFERVVGAVSMFKELIASHGIVDNEQ